MVACLINRAKNEGQISVVIPNILNDGLLILQYADDTTIFMDQARNMKLLIAFEQMFGLNINYQKGEVFCFGHAKDHELQYEQLFGCRKGSYPFRYLGIPVHFRKLYNSDWKKIEERIEKKIELLERQVPIGGGQIGVNNSSSYKPLDVYAFLF
jgi:hypothetical protein